MSSGTKALLFGCLGILLVAGVLAVAGAVWFGKKVSKVMENPVQFAAEMLVKGEPGLEVVSSDKEKQTVVIRDVKTGEEITFTMEDLKDGKLTMKKSDGSSAEFGPGGLRIRDKDGKDPTVPQ